MVTLRRSRASNEVNRAMGYPAPETRTPRELDNDE